MRLAWLTPGGSVQVDHLAQQLFGFGLVHALEDLRQHIQASDVFVAAAADGPGLDFRRLPDQFGCLRQVTAFAVKYPQLEKAKGDVGVRRAQAFAKDRQSLVQELRSPRGIARPKKRAVTVLAGGILRVFVPPELLAQ